MAASGDRLPDLKETLDNLGFLDRFRFRRIQARCSRGDTLSARGDLAAARQLYTRVVSDYEQLLGRETLLSLTAREDLALTYADKPAEALPRLQELLPAFERVAGPDDRRTLKLRTNIATTTGMSGDNSAARDQFEAVAADYERVFGTENEDLAAVRQMLEYARTQAARIDA